MIADVEPFEIPTVFRFSLGPLAIVGIGALFYAWRGASRKAKLYSRGVIGSAKVLSVQEKRRWLSFPFWSVTRFPVEYSFTSSTGEGIVGRSITRNVALARKLRAGEEVDVLYLPEDERVNCLADKGVLLRCRSAA